MNTSRCLCCRNIRCPKLVVAMVAMVAMPLLMGSLARANTVGMIQKTLQNPQPN